MSPTSSTAGTNSSSGSTRTGSASTRQGYASGPPLGALPSLVPGQTGVRSSNISEVARATAPNAWIPVT